MLARCRLAKSRSHDNLSRSSPPNDALAHDERQQAEVLFEDYLKRYPRGRFVADVPGWLGALAFADGNYARALDCYLQQANVPDHPEVLKSAGFMCERCLSELDIEGDPEELTRVAANPRLAMSLIYVIVGNSAAKETSDPDPAKVQRWKRDILPRLAAAVVEHKDAYASSDWQPRYLAILAQAASGSGDQARALALCEMAKDQLGRSDDLAFIHLVALERARRLPEAITAGREFARLYPASPFAAGAALRVVLALQDDHQAGAAVAEIHRLRKRAVDQARQNNEPEPPEDQQLAQIADALLNFAPLPELAAALTPAGTAGQTELAAADEANLRAVLVQRWLTEENFGEASKYTVPGQWSQAATALQQLTAAATAAPPGQPRADACLRVADAWVAARGKLLFAPLETDEARDLFKDDYNERAGLSRRENGLALGVPAEVLNHSLSSRDEWQHGFAWYLKAADAAPSSSPGEARALWAALRLMPSIALASPYTFQRAGETNAGALSRQLYDRLIRDCPESREASAYAVYYDLTPPALDESSPNYDAAAPAPDLAGAMTGEGLLKGEPEYRWDVRPGYAEWEPLSNTRTPDEDKLLAEVTGQILSLANTESNHDPTRLRVIVNGLRARLKTARLDLNDLFLCNFLDDLGDFLQEPAINLTPAAVTKYLELRTECLTVEHWGEWGLTAGYPKVEDYAVLAHIQEAAVLPALAAFPDYLDFLVLAVKANDEIDVPIPGETEEDSDGTKHPRTRRDRDYPAIAKLAGEFLVKYPHSRKRDAALLLSARALYAASRPLLLKEFAAWPESHHFASGSIVKVLPQPAFNPGEILAALDASDREFPGGRYAGDIRNLRGLLAWHTRNWPLALDLTLATLADAGDPLLQSEAARRLVNIFVDGLTNDEERQRCLAAIKTRAAAIKQLRDFLPKSPYPFRTLQSWLLAQF